MSLAAGSIFESVASWLDGPELAECVLHHKIVTAPSGDNNVALDAFTDQIEQDWENVTETCMCASTKLVGVQVRILPPSVGSGFTYSEFSAAVGEVSGENVGAQECAIFSKYTEELSRQGRGRVYLPFVPESFVNSGCLTMAAKGYYEAAMAPLLLENIDFGAGGVAKPGVWSRVGNTFHNMAFAPLRSVTVTQRRRVKRKQPFAA